MTGKYQWPASRLADGEMALLFREKQKTKSSICELLRRAVDIAYGKVSGEVDAGGRKKNFGKAKKEGRDDD